MPSSANLKKTAALTGRPANATVKSAVRVLEIFEYFDEVRRPATIQEIAQHLGYPHSSTTALLKSLVGLGYLEHDPKNKSFFPTIRLSLLGNWIEAETLPIRNIHRLMSFLSDETGCTVTLAIRTNIHAQYIKVIQGTTPIRFHVKPGTKRLLPFSTVGRVLLGELPPEKARALITQAIAAAPSGRTETLSKIEEEVAKTRRRGYGFYTGLVTPNATMLAMPLRTGSPTHTDARVVVLGIGAPRDHFRDKKQTLIDLMKRAIATHMA